MARQRLLKPSFFTNEDLGECSLAARLFFAGMWCWADREGYLEDRPKRLRAEILPYDNVDGEALLSELSAKGLVERLVADGVKVIRIVNFLKHQDPHPREVKSRFAPGRTEPNLGSPKADLGSPKADLGEFSSPSPSSPSRPSSPSSLPAPQTPTPLASMPGWLAGVQEALSVELGQPIHIGKDPEATVEAFEQRRAFHEACGVADPDAEVVGDCLAIAKRSRAGVPGTLSFFTGWFDRATPKTTKGRG